MPGLAYSIVLDAELVPGPITYRFPMVSLALVRVDTTLTLSDSD